MTEQILITIETRRYAALIESLRLARYALLRSGRRFDCPPYDGYSVAAKIDWICNLSDRELAGEKARAFALGYENYSASVLKPKYFELLGR